MVLIQVCFSTLAGCMQEALSLQYKNIFQTHIDHLMEQRDISEKDKSPTASKVNVAAAVVTAFKGDDKTWKLLHKSQFPVKKARMS